MKITSFSHVNVRTAQLAEMIAWYGDVLGMHTGPRPDFGIGGAWLYVGDAPFIHLVEAPTEPRTRDPKIEHFAFNASGIADFAARLDARDISHTIDPVPGFPLIQINLHDPDGNHIHVDFDRGEAEAAGLA